MAIAETDMVLRRTRPFGPLPAKNLLPGMIPTFSWSARAVSLSASMCCGRVSHR